MSVGESLREECEVGLGGSGRCKCSRVEASSWSAVVVAVGCFTSKKHATDIQAAI